MESSVQIAGAVPLQLHPGTNLVRVAESCRSACVAALHSAGFEIIRAPQLPWPELPDRLHPQDPIPAYSLGALTYLDSLLSSTLGAEQARLGTMPHDVEALIQPMCDLGFSTYAGQLLAWAQAVAAGTAPRDPVACELEARARDLQRRWRLAERTRIRPEQGRLVFQQLLADRETLTAQLTALCGDVPLRELAAPPAGWSAFKTHIRSLMIRQALVDQAVATAATELEQCFDALAAADRVLIDAPISWLDADRLLALLDGLADRGTQVVMLVEVWNWPGRSVALVDPVDIELTEPVQSLVEDAIWLPDEALPSRRRPLRSLLRLGDR